MFLPLTQVEIRLRNEVTAQAGPAGGGLSLTPGLIANLLLVPSDTGGG